MTTKAYDAFVEAHSLQAQIIELAKGVSASDVESSRVASEQIRELLMEGEMPKDLAIQLITAYQNLIQDSENAVAVHSSKTAEDLPTASFVGQQDTFLNIHGEAALLEAVKKCWATLWTARAIAYRMRRGIDPDVISLAVVVQELVDEESAGIYPLIALMSRNSKKSNQYENCVSMQSSFKGSFIINETEKLLFDAFLLRIPAMYVSGGKRLDIFSKNVQSERLNLRHLLGGLVL